MNPITYLLSYIVGIPVEKQPSRISGKLEVWLQNGRYVLHSTAANYSFDTLHVVFQRTFRHIRVQHKNPARVLVLGLGAGSIPAILYDELQLQPEITGVEQDEVVVQLAQKYFNIQRYKHLKVILDDAIRFMQCCAEKFDLVINDVFVHTDVPEAACQTNYLHKLVQCTATGGTGLFNFITETPEQHKAFSQTERTLRSLSSKVEVFHASEVNAVLMWQG
ncbi:MAG: hypothetical protein KatS3mg032_1465 [Cyclobacteriaceae bacterium]|nr:MAG: hypothetical protein KatS3mg032_1465 [Cyclobacteriaceae bacterium]